MKIFLLSAVFLATTFSAQELVPNSSFESWVGRSPDYPTSWNCSNCTKGDAHTGNLGVNLNITSTVLSDGFNSDRGAVNIEDGKTYEVKFWYKTNTANMKNVTINITRSGGSRHYYGQVTSTINDNQWHLFSDTFTANITAPGQIYLSPSLQSSGSPGNMIFDDVSITQSTLATSEQNKSTFKSYPKAVDENITFTEPIEKIEIISAEGRNIPISYSVGDNQINLKHLKKGVYFINAKSKKGNLIQEKIIKK